MYGNSPIYMPNNGDLTLLGNFSGDRKAKLALFNRGSFGDVHVYSFDERALKLIAGEAVDPISTTTAASSYKKGDKLLIYSDSVKVWGQIPTYNIGDLKGILSYGDEVEIIDDSIRTEKTLMREFKNYNINGYWVQVKASTETLGGTYEEVEGYIFDGYFSNLPLCQSNSLKEYVEKNFATLSSNGETTNYSNGVRCDTKGCSFDNISLKDVYFVAKQLTNTQFKPTWLAQSTDNLITNNIERNIRVCWTETRNIYYPNYSQEVTPKNGVGEQLTKYEIIKIPNSNSVRINFETQLKTYDQSYYNTSTITPSKSVLTRCN
jgi:hypothetical protein